MALSTAETQLRELHKAGRVTLRVSRSWTPCVWCTYKDADGLTVSRLGGAATAIGAVHKIVFNRQPVTAYHGRPRTR